MSTFVNPEPRTQKARSVIALSKGLSTGLTPPYWLAQSEESLIEAFKLCKQGGAIPFGRPCPTLPRPGFYESCELTSEDHCREMWTGTMALDPKAEVLVMPWQMPALSATWTPGLLGVGPGNDGATAGINAIAIPVAPFAPVAADIHSLNKSWRAMIKDAGVLEHPDEAQRNPHLETVYKHRYNNEFITRYVQLRAGAAATGAGDYIPRDTKVTHIIKADHDYSDSEAMIKWEVTTRELGQNPEGVLIWHPSGHQGTHTALHCKNNGLAVTMQEEEPQVGDFFQCTDKPLPVDVDEVLRYAAAGLTIPLSRKQIKRGVLSPGQALDLMLLLTHGYRPSGKEARWIGAAAAIMLRLGAAALLGERRHAGGRHRSREQIHERSFSNWFTARGSITEAAKKFANHKWPGGFGGKAWLECTMSLADLDGWLVKLARKRDEDSLKGLVAALNNTLNKAHNNGWWMNKFGEKASMDLAAAGNPTIALRCAPFAYQLHEWVQTSGELIDSLVDKLSTSRRLRCLSDEALVPKPPSTKILVDTIHYNIKGNGEKDKSLIHFQFYTKDKGPYHTHDVLGNHFTSEEWEAVTSHFKEANVKTTKSYADSGTLYAPPVSACEEKGGRIVAVILTTGVTPIKLDVGNLAKKGDLIVGANTGSSDSLFVPKPATTFNEADYYDASCECSVCVTFFASQAEEVAENEADKWYCEECDEYHDA